MALLLKLPLLVLEAVCMRISGIPPNPPTSSGHVVVPDWREHFLRNLAYPSKILRITSWLAQFVEFIVIVAYCNPTGPMSHLVLKTLVTDTSCVVRLGITPLFLMGNGINLAGTILRVLCYRTLGRLFVFELRIQKDHRLVTDGPYAYVRHPSYTGLILSILGAFLGHASSSWILQCGPLQNAFIQALTGLWITVAIAVISSLLLRTSREDAMLKKAFGDSWVKWSEKVPYQLIPGVDVQRCLRIEPKNTICRRRPLTEGYYANISTTQIMIMLVHFSLYRLKGSWWNLKAKGANKAIPIPLPFEPYGGCFTV